MISSNRSIPSLPLFTAAQMRAMEAAAVGEIGIPGRVLMENAGRAAARVLMDDWGVESAAVLCGRGNNGGDGMVIARHLRADGADVSVWLLGEPESVGGDARAALQSWLASGGTLQVLDAKSLPRFRRAVQGVEMAVDALFGTGLNTPIEGLALKAVEALNQAAAVLAVDIPSGIHADTGAVLGAAVRADTTVTFGGWKVGLAVTPGTEYAGEVIVADIGIPSRAVVEAEHFLLRREILEGLFPPRGLSDHKGQFGHLLSIAGARGKTGAALMAAESALRVGTGLVTTATPESLLSVIASGLREGMTAPIPDSGTGHFLGASSDALVAACADKSAVLIGPGINNDEDSLDWLGFLLMRLEMPLVIDADGLNTLARLHKWARHLHYRKAPTLLTPHPGEMARLVGISTEEVQAHRVAVARQTARAGDCIVVLKGAHTLIAAPDGRVFVNPTGNPALATAGSGDVLAGLLAGLVAQGRDPLWAAAAAVHYHGWLADHLRDEGRERLLAGDLLREIGRRIER